MASGRMEHREQTHQALLDERRQLLELLTAGDAMFGLIHEINNSLNSMMLQASIVGLKVTGTLKDEVTEIRRLGTQAARQLAMVQHFRDQFRNSRSQIDLNQVVRDELQEIDGSIGSVDTALCEQSLVLTVNAGALRRLVSLLFRIVRRSQTAEAPLTVRTQRAQGHIALSVGLVGFHSEDANPIDWDATPDDATDTEILIERLAIQSLARLIAAQVDGFVRPDGELSVSVEWSEDKYGFAAG